MTLFHASRKTRDSQRQRPFRPARVRLTCYQMSAINSASYSGMSRPRSQLPMNAAWLAAQPTGRRARSSSILFPSRPVAVALLDSFELTSSAPRPVSLRVLVCAAEIVTDTYSYVMKCASHEDAALETSIAMTRDFAMALMADVRKLQ